MRPTFTEASVLYKICLHVRNLLTYIPVQWKKQGLPLPIKKRRETVGTLGGRKERSTQIQTHSLYNQTCVTDSLHASVADEPPYKIRGQRVGKPPEEVAVGGRAVQQLLQDFTDYLRHKEMNKVLIMKVDVMKKRLIQNFRS